MQVYKVEIFDRDFVLRSHTNVTSVDYSEDYLSPEANAIVLNKIEASVGDYIWITNELYKFFGVVSAVSSESEDLLTISYKSFLTEFDTSILFDTSIQGDKGSQTLENYIANTLHQTFGYNTDASMNIPHMTIRSSSSTSKWSLGLQSDEEYSHYCIANLLKHIIIPAFERYSIAILVEPDISAKDIIVTVGVSNASIVTIEADLPNVVKKYVTVRQNDNFVNKVVVYNSENYIDKVVYYRHPDGTFSILDANRIVPVVQEMYAVAPTYEDEVIVETFAEKALDQAIDAFSVVEYNNLIELTMPIDDPLNKPMGLKIGQVANIISDDKQYQSILSGKTVSNTVTLVFGIVRVDLTKKIWRSSYGY